MPKLEHVPVSAVRAREAPTHPTHDSARARRTPCISVLGCVTRATPAPFGIKAPKSSSLLLITDKAGELGSGQRVRTGRDANEQDDQGRRGDHRHGGAGLDG